MQPKVIKDKIIFISWTNFSSHSRLLAEAFGAPIYYINDLHESRNLLRTLFIWIDYISKAIRTFRIILKSKPKIVIVQNPPSIAPILLILWRKFGSYKVLVDSHNGAFEGKWKVFPFHKWALRQANIVTIHNNQLFERLLNDPSYEKINFKVLNSKLTDFSNIKKNPQEKSYFLVVNTFAVDEPIETILEGILEFSNRSDSQIQFKVGGNFNKYPILFSKYSSCKNIEFIGFVPEDQYNYNLVNSFGVISLSTRDDVQQFALTEAIGAEVPFISNNNATNRDLFDDKMVLTELTPLAISNSINTFIKDREQLNNNVKEIKKTLANKWGSNFIKIKNELGI